VPLLIAEVQVDGGPGAREAYMYFPDRAIELRPRRQHRHGVLKSLGTGRLLVYLVERTEEPVLEVLRADTPRLAVDRRERGLAVGAMKEVDPVGQRHE